MKVAEAVMACLEYHQANSEKKHGKWVSIRTRSVCRRLWREKN